VRTVVFDKTGTLTEGRPTVTGVAAAAGVSETELLAWAGSAERGSEHPLAEAVVVAAEGRSAPLRRGTTERRRTSGREARWRRARLDG